MFVVTEADAAAIRAVFQQRGEFAAAVELRRRFPGITDNRQARECVRTIAGWKPLRLWSGYLNRRGYGGCADAAGAGDAGGDTVRAAWLLSLQRSREQIATLRALPLFHAGRRLPWHCVDQPRFHLEDRHWSNLSLAAFASCPLLCWVLRLRPSQRRLVRSLALLRRLRRIGQGHARAGCSGQPLVPVEA